MPRAHAHAHVHYPYRCSHSHCAAHCLSVLPVSLFCGVFGQGTAAAAAAPGSEVVFRNEYERNRHRNRRSQVVFR